MNRQTESRASTAVVPDCRTVSVPRWRTELSVTLRGTGVGPRDEATARRCLIERAAQLERAASRFDPDSESSAVSRSAGRWVGVSWFFIEVLSSALDAAEATGGLVNPAMGAEVIAAGYDRWAGEATAAIPGQSLSEPNQRPGSSGRPQSRWQEIEIRPGPRGAEVRVPPGVVLDLGAVAKGRLADDVAEELAEAGWDVLANMGGDLRAISHDGPWTVGADPGLPGLAPQGLLVTDAGLATSGIGRRTWSGPNGTAHHIIDPRTGRPADTPWWSVSVLASTAREANAAATAAIIHGPAAPEWLARTGLASWLVAKSSAEARGSGLGRDLRIAGWPEPVAVAS